MIRIPVLLATVTLASGCATAFKSVAAKFAEPPPPPHAGELTEIVTLWQPGEGRADDGLPTRGFAGQVFFFKPGSEEPVAVNADIVVYVFDDVGALDEQKEPIHRIHFSSEAWNTHRRDSGVGTCYQLILPYTRPGDHRAVCSLRVVAQPRNGRRTASRSEEVRLDGRRVEPSVQLNPVDWMRESPPKDRKIERVDNLDVFSIPLSRQHAEARR